MVGWLSLQGKRMQVRPLSRDLKTDEMEIFDGKIAVTVEELTSDQGGDAVMTMINYKNLVNRNRITVLRRGCRCTPALVEYSSLPDRFKEAFRTKYGDPKEMMKSEKPHLAINADAKEYFEKATLANGKSLTDELIEQYTINASVLDLLRDGLMAQKAGRKRLGNSTAIKWDAIHNTSEMLRRDFEHTLPAGKESLRRKLDEYMKEGFSCLISKKLGNSNTLKIPAEGGKLMIALRRSRVPIYTEQQIFEEYNRRAAKMGWKPLQSPNTVKQYLSRPEIEQKWYAAVYGELAAKQKFDRKHRTVLPEKSDTLWYGDGTKLNLYFKGRDKNGKLVKMTAMVYEVIDAYSEMFLGYSIGPVENTDLQRRAFKMAIQRSGHCPFEIVTDNQGGQKKNEARGFMAKICRVSRTTAPHTPQAKSIEQVFGRFQAQVLHRDWRFTGQNMTATSIESRANTEFIEDNVDKLYTYEEMCAAYAEYREQWNDMLHPRTDEPRRKMYFSSINPEVHNRRVSERDIVDMFWRETELPSEFTSSGITIQVDKQRYTYEVFGEDGLPDMSFRSENTGRQFFVQYDPDDMTKVWLCTHTAVGTRKVRMAEPYAVVHRAIQEQSAEEMAFIREMTEQGKRARVARQMEGYQFDLEQGIAPEQHGLRSSRIRGLSRRDQERIADEYYVTMTSEWQDRMEPIGVGEEAKIISNMTFDEASLISKF